MSQPELYNPGDGLSEGSEHCSEVGKGAARIDVTDKGVRTIKHTSQGEVAASPKEQVSVHDFSAFLGMTRCEKLG